MTGYRLPASWMEFHAKDDVNRDPTTWWAPTSDCAEEMLRSCGFCNVTTVSAAHRRAVLHAFSPEFSEEGLQIVRQYGEEPVATAYSALTGREVATGAAASAIQGLSTPEFAQLKQQLAEDRARRWHQEERWRP
jgi:hypothetical protein